MPCLPQLSTGALAQFPTRRRISTRSVVNRSLDGSELKFYDADAGVMRWTLTYVGLSESELGAIESFFDAVEGRLRSFLWLDPSANLIAWSEDLSATEWQIDAQLQLTSGQSDPLGSNNGTLLVNNGQTVQRLTQWITGPAMYTYCFSCWLRSDAATPITMSVGTTTSAKESVVMSQSGWTRFSVTEALGSSDETVRFSLGLPPGSSASAFGVQVEPQPSPGPYQRTTQRAGVYPSARLDQDELVVEATGPNMFNTTIRIIAPLQG